MGVLSKVCMAEGVTPLETAFWRAAFGLLFFLGHTLFTRQIAVPPRVAANFILFGVWGINNVQAVGKNIRRDASGVRFDCARCCGTA